LTNIDLDNCDVHSSSSVVYRNPTSLYPLSVPLAAAGFIGGVLALSIFQSLAIGSGVLVLFTICGLTWRRDMPPIIPFCLAFQWVGAHVGVMYYQVYGNFPGGGDPENLPQMLWAVQLGLIFATLGLRVGMSTFRTALKRTLGRHPRHYSLNRLTQLTIIMFVSSYFVDAVPSAIWLGGAQIIHNLMGLRFLPYFILLLIVFEQRSGYNKLALATMVVLMPQLLTGFSDFKEIFFVILLSALYQWRPWVNSAAQRRRNMKIASGAVIGGVATLILGMIWTGGVKEQWREELWYSQNTVATSPIERMTRFGSILGEVSTDLDIEQANQALAARLSSGSLYFSYVLKRVPETIPHERGELLGRAVENAVLPRFLFPNKTNLGGDSWLVRTYAGLTVAGDETGASIGLGYMPEFYIDFGYTGIAALCFFYGFVLACCMWAFAKVSPTGPILTALTIGLFMNFFQSLDASFIKMLAGMLQHTLIASLAVACLAPLVLRWLARNRQVRRVRKSALAKGK
jgi:hypothetical protein